jgi:AcrR family transcriptional regulator
MMDMAQTAPAERKKVLGEARQDLLRIAIDCFAVHGYQGTTIDMIARAAGMTKGALYYHFRDKEALLFEAVRDRVADFEHRVVAGVTPVEDSVRALRGIADSCLFVATRNNHRRFLLTLMVEAIDSNAELATQFREMMQRFRGFVAAIIRGGQKRGIFRFDVEPQVAAKAYIAGIMGAEIQYYQDSEDVSLDEVMGCVIDQTLAWLAPRGTDTGGATPAGSGDGDGRGDDGQPG